MQVYIAKTLGIGIDHGNLHWLVEAFPLTSIISPFGKRAGQAARVGAIAHGHFLAIAAIDEPPDGREESLLKERRRTVSS